MSECVFCRIISGDIPAAVLMQTDKIISFLDINPVNRGHALIMPKRHVASLLELGDDELQAAIVAARRVAAAVCKGTNSPAFNILENDGEPAGQLIDHAHFHVIPRRLDDGFSFGWRRLSYKEGELKALQEDIKRKL